MATELTQEALKEVLNYDPETGLFTWAKQRGSARKGSLAGCLDRGHLIIRVNKQQYLAHRLAWMYMYGYFPATDIRHINKVKDDNRIDNLTKASRRCTESIGNSIYHNKSKKKEIKIMSNYDDDSNSSEYDDFNDGYEDYDSGSGDDYPEFQDFDY